ncbi:hypothetical protein [Ralstonia sp. UBA689]|uniref:hypothetical protein n=1 Tax=Ralstonia sp. UBA689 TaxID=1947373 RepID=UPI0025F5BC4E|nr:hypothetical protein [Ralstonia sp. UBA689]
MNEYTVRFQVKRTITSEQVKENLSLTRLPKSLGNNAFTISTMMGLSDLKNGLKHGFPNTQCSIDEDDSSSGGSSSESD